MALNDSNSNYFQQLALKKLIANFQFNKIRENIEGTEFLTFHYINQKFKKMYENSKLCVTRQCSTEFKVCTMLGVSDYVQQTKQASCQFLSV